MFAIIEGDTKRIQDFNIVKGQLGLYRKVITTSGDLVDLIWSKVGDEQDLKKVGLEINIVLEDSELVFNKELTLIKNGNTRTKVAKYKLALVEVIKETGGTVYLFSKNLQEINKYVVEVADIIIRGHQPLIINRSGDIMVINKNRMCKQ